MLLSYFKIGFRNLWKNKRFSAINLLGLSIGMAAAILILLWVQHEMSFDRFYSNQDRLFQSHEQRAPSMGNCRYGDIHPRY